MHCLLAIIVPVLQDFPVPVEFHLQIKSTCVKQFFYYSANGKKPGLHHTMEFVIAKIYLLKFGQISNFFQYDSAERICRQGKILQILAL